MTPSKAQTICDTSVKALPHCARLYFFCSLWSSKWSQFAEGRCFYARKFIQGLFPKSLTKDHMNTDLLYRAVLDYEMSGSIAVPPVPDKSLLHKYEDNIIYTWLLYAYYKQQMSSQGEDKEVYETAMCRIKNTQHVKTICRQYLMSQSHTGLSEGNSYSKAKDYMDLVNRCLSVTPCILVNEQRVKCTDYSFHNKMINYVGNLLSESDVTSWYETWLEKHPENTQLLARLCDMYLAISDYTSICYVCKVLPGKRIQQENLWIVYLSSLIKRKRFKEALSLARKSVQILPHSTKLWKKYLSIMMSIATPLQEVKRAIRVCRETDINISTFLSALPAELQQDS